MLGLSLGIKSPPVMRQSAGLGQTLTALPVAAYARWHPAFSVVSLSAGRVVAASDMQGVAGLTEGVVGNGPQALMDGNGRKFWRFSESEFLNIAAGLTLDNRNASVFFVGRAHRASSGTPIFSGGNVAQGSQLSGGGQQNGAVTVVPAGVHHARGGGAPFSVAFFRNRQRIHIRTQPDNRAGTVFQRAEHAGARQTTKHLQSRPL